LITNEKTISQNPNLVHGMVKAFLHGLSDTITDPAAAYETSKAYVQNLAQLDPALQKQKLATSIELWKADKLGFSQPKAWESMQTVLLDMGLLTKALDLSKAYSNNFIP
jgi:NitT/TauT family transport system substrate-binding protein